MAVNVEAQLKDIVSRELGIDVDEITRDGHFRDDLGADSLDHTELIMAAEEAFDIEIADDDADELATFGQLVDYVSAKCSSRRRRSA